jgi:hypothetical protein
MKNKTLRRWLLFLEGFLAFTAIAGGIALVANFNAPSVDDLRGTPFPDYTVPGLALLLLVGGSALLATIALLRRHHRALLVAMASGVIILCFEIVEVLTIGSPPGVGRNLQIFYCVLGIFILALAAAHMRNDRVQNVDGNQP